MSSKSDGTLDRNLGGAKLSTSVALNGESIGSKRTESKIVNPTGLTLATFCQQQPRPNQAGAANKSQLQTIPFASNLNTTYSGGGNMQQQQQHPSSQLIPMSSKVSTAGRYNTRNILL